MIRARQHLHAHMEHTLIAECQRCMMSIFSDMIEEIMEVFMDDFLVYGKTFDHCLENLDKVLQRCQEKDLVLN